MGSADAAGAESRDRPLTAEERKRGLHPRTLEDLQFRSRAFAPIVAGLAEKTRKKAPKTKKR